MAQITKSCLGPARGVPPPARSCYHAPGASRSEAAIQAGCRLQLIRPNRDLRIDAETRFLVDTQRTGSPNLQAVTATNRPIVATYGGSLGATETFNRLSVSLRGSVDRSEFEDARLSDGTVISQAETRAAATRNMMTAVVLAAVTNTA